MATEQAVCEGCESVVRDEALTSGFTRSCALLAETEVSSRERLSKRQG